MDIFVSWAGSGSHQVALVLRQWLPEVLRFVRPWVSSEDIRKGTRWSDELWGRLRSTSYSIVCVTPEAVRSPWVNFEAGAVARAVGGQSYVSPLLLGMSAGDLGGVPLAMFQCTEFRRRDVGRLVKAINTAAPAPMQASQVALRFRRRWPSLRDDIGRIDITNADDSELEEALQDEAAHVWLEEIEDKILEMVAWSGDTQPLAVLDIAHGVSENHVVTQHYLDELVRRRFLHERKRAGSLSTYSATSRARAYAVENQLV